MKKSALLFFLFPSLLWAQEKMGSWKDTTTEAGCKYLVVQKITLDIDEIGLLTSKDTSNILLVTVKNTCSNCKQEGPDYTGLIVYDGDGKIIAQEAINGIPGNGKSRLYYVHCTKRLRALPPQLKVSLVHYCTSMKVKKK